MKNYSKEIPNETDDFKALMHFMLRFMRVNDLSFENDLLGMMKTRVYLRPQVIQAERKAADKAFFVAKGIVIAFYYSANQEIIPFRIFSAGEIALIPDSFMTSKAATYNLMASGDSRLMEITLSQMQGVYTRFPASVMLALLIVASLFDKDRVRDEMIGLGREKSIAQFYKVNPELYGNTTYRIRDKYIANYLHMAPVTFCRLRKKISPNYPQS